MKTKKKMKQLIICKYCGFKYLISYPNDIIWDNGEIECNCGKIIKFCNNRFENLYI